MVTSALVLTIDADSTVRRAAMDVLRADTRLVLGEIVGARLPVVAETTGLGAGEQLVEELSRIAGVLFIDVRDHQNVYVGWRVGHLLFMASAVPIAIALERIAEDGGWQRYARIAAFAVVIAVAAPTVAIDLYNTQDITNRHLAAGFRWTLLLTHDELDAFRILKWMCTARPGYQPG